MPSILLYIMSLLGEKGGRNTRKPSDSFLILCWSNSGLFTQVFVKYMPSDEAYR